MSRPNQHIRRSSRLLAMNEAKSEIQMEKLSKKKKQPVEEPVSTNKKPDEENDAGTEAQRKAFGNYLVLTTIMKKLRTRDLINCRLINSSWKETADLILTGRKDLKAIHLIYHEETEIFDLNSLENRELSELHQILENSTNFPCTDFKIRGPLDRPDLQNFLSSFGGHMKKLNLNFASHYDLDSQYRSFGERDEDNPSHDEFDRKEVNTLLLRKLLSEQAPNLESLVLYKICLRNNIGNKPTSTSRGTLTKIFPSPVNLSSLKHLEIETYSWKRSYLLKNEIRWTGELLVSAPNLKSFKSSGGIRTEILDSLVNLNKSHLLTEMRIESRSRLPSDDLILSLFKLKNVTQDNFARFSIGRLLSLNMDTLTTLSLGFYDAANTLQEITVHGGSIKVFVHVKTFCLIALEKVVEGRVQIKIPLKTLFPNLEKILLDGAFNYHRSKESYYTRDNFPFDPTEPLDKVKTLEIRHMCPLKWLKLLPQILPNVEHLILDNYWDFHRSGKLFWSFTKVKSMELGTMLGVDNLDSVFTGFLVKTCKKLKEKALDQLLEPTDMSSEDRDEIEELRVAPSILQLKDLRELRIKVADTDEFVRVPGVYSTTLDGRHKLRWQPLSSPSNVNLMSPVTAVYAFGMMPSLQAVEIYLTPNETKYLNYTAKGDLRRLNNLAAALEPMAKHPLVTLYPIQKNNE